MAAKRSTFIIRYALAVLSAGAAMALAHTIYHPWVTLSPFFLFYAAVAFSSWYGGSGPGLLTLLLGVIGTEVSLMGGLGTWRAHRPDEIARLVVFIAVGLLIALMNGALHRANRRCEAEAKAYNEHLRAMGAELMMAEERERRRIATVLHDSVVQTLALMKMRVETTREDATDDPRVVAQLTDIRRLLDSAITQTRTLTADLSPPVLYELGLVAAIQWLGDRMLSEHRIAFEMPGQRQIYPLNEETRITLFQAVRELLANVIKHSRATTCSIDVSMDEASRQLMIRVDDNGVGVSTAATQDYSKGGFGLFNIRQRLTHLGGSLRISPRPGGGTRVIISAPTAVDQQAPRSPDAHPPGVRPTSQHQMTTHAADHAMQPAAASRLAHPSHL
jgi:signal transduction histidine kinase